MGNIFCQDSYSKDSSFLAGSLSVSKEHQYQQLEINQTIPGNFLIGNKPRVMVLRIYFIPTTDESNGRKLNLQEVYVIDGKTKIIRKCQVDTLSKGPRQPILRFLTNGKIVYDDETTAPSFFELTEKWWVEKICRKKFISMARRTEKTIESLVHRNMHLDMQEWVGPNIGPYVEHFLQGGNFALQLETLDGYCTNLTDKYSDVFKNKTEIYYSQYIKHKGNEAKLIWISHFEDQWADLEKTIRGQAIPLTNKLFIESNENTEPIQRGIHNDTIFDDIDHDEFEMSSDMDFENDMETTLVENE